MSLALSRFKVNITLVKRLRTVLAHICNVIQIAIFWHVAANCNVLFSKLWNVAAMVTTTGESPSKIHMQIQFVHLQCHSTLYRATEVL